MQKKGGGVFMLKKLRNLLTNGRKVVMDAFFTLSAIIVVNCPVLADSIDQAISTQSSKAVESRLFGSTKTVLMAVGGGAIAIAMGIVGLTMILAHKRQETRTEALASIGWIVGGAVLIGAIAIFVGFFWGTFGLKG
jgi:hypothetical protein